jgi:hypothetical protein
MEADELIALIERAFPTQPFPERTLRQATLSDQGMSREISEEEREAAGRIDRNVSWTALTDNDLMECEAGISHLWGPEFAYYLGALLRFAVRHLEASIWTREGSLVSSIIHNVTNEPSNERVRQYIHDRWGALDAAEIEVVRRFLDYVTARSHHYRTETSRALARYWNAAQPQEPDYCPVCAYALPFPARGGKTPRTDACPCCGIRFGIDDVAGGYLVRGTIYRHWRAQWFSAGMPWRSRDVPKPEGWTAAAQLERLRRKS